MFGNACSSRILQGKIRRRLVPWWGCQVTGEVCKRSAGGPRSGCARIPHHGSFLSVRRVGPNTPCGAARATGCLMAYNAFPGWILGRGAQVALASRNLLREKGARSIWVSTLQAFDEE